MKKTLVLILACCLLAGCSANPELKDSGEPYISSPVFSENSSEPESAPASSSVTSSQPQSSTPASSSAISSQPQSSAPASSSAISSQPQSSAPASSAISSKPQSSAPASSSAISSQPQSSAPASSAISSQPQSSAPASSSVTSSQPQSSAPASSSAISSQPQSSAPASSSVTSSETSTPAEPEIIGPYGQRAPEQWEIEYANEVFRLTNIERVNNGLPEFKRLPLLDEVANIRAWELIPCYDHDRPDGSSCFTAYEEAGIAYSYAAENIAAGYKTPEEVVNGWMNSTNHRKNILNPDLEYLGVGFYYDKDKMSEDNYRYYWSQNFCSTWDQT